LKGLKKKKKSVKKGKFVEGCVIINCQELNNFETAFGGG